MRTLYEWADRAAASPINVLIQGETGVGKEIIDALQRCAGNQTRAACMLGICRRTAYRQSHPRWRIRRRLLILRFVRKHHRHRWPHDEELSDFW